MTTQDDDFRTLFGAGELDMLYDGTCHDWNVSQDVNLEWFDKIDHLDEDMVWDFALQPSAIDHALENLARDHCDGDGHINPREADNPNDSPLSLSPKDQVQPTVENHPISTTPLERLENGDKQSPHKRRQPRIPPEARAVLVDYYTHTPYPTTWEIDILAHQTKLEAHRVRNWFSNTRTRCPTHPDNDSLVAKCHEARPNSARLSKDSLEKLSLDLTLDQQPPMEAWMSSSMQSEPVAVAIIEAEVAKRNSNLDFKWGPSKTSSASIKSRAASVNSSWVSSAGSAATRNTGYTTSSKGSKSSSLSRTRRRGRKCISKADPYPSSQDRKSVQQPKASPRRDPSPPSKARSEYAERPFICTFCGDRFKTQYEWTRHEESLHMPRMTWVCCMGLEPSLSECPFCSMPSPDERHLSTHALTTCASRSEEERTFYRRDHFVQHLHNTHFSKTKHPDAYLGCPKGAGFGCSALVEKWRRPAPPLPKDDPALHCGFCGNWLATWEQRRQHVASYFKTRKDLSSWWPNRLPNTLTGELSPVHRGFFRCRYCRKVIAKGDQTHSSCFVWSCRFLRSIDHLKYKDEFGDVTLPPFTTMKYSQSYRDCNQEFYASFEEFTKHLEDFHGAREVVWPRFRSVLGPEYSRTKRAVFELAEQTYTAIASPPREKHHQNRSLDYSVSISPPPAYPAPPPPLHYAHTKFTLSVPTNTLLPTSSPVPSSSEHIPEPNLEAYLGMPTLIDVSHQMSTASRNRGSSQMLSDSPTDPPPRFFLSFLLPLPILYYLKGGRSFPRIRPRNDLGLMEISHGYIGSLVMSSALVGMAGAGWAPDMKKDEVTGLVGFSMVD